MQITITARHFDLTNAIREHVEEMTEKLEKYFDHIIYVHYILSLENNRNKVELILNIPKNNLKSEANEKDMYLAIDKAIEKMEHQVTKIKGKWINHNKKSLKESTHFVYANLIERGKEKKRVKTKRIVAEVLSVNEALDAFEQIEDPYLIFKNMETDKINVLVKKDDLHYKLLEP
jgi:putative sigma-54 modulation protein